MAVKMLSKRSFKPEHRFQASKILIRACYAAMKMEGRIGSETWHDLRDPNIMLR